MSETMELPGGERMPRLGLGTWRLSGGECERVVRAALELGYRHLDTARVYKNEADVGRAIRGRDRGSLFLTSKAWRDHLAPRDLALACEKSLRKLGTDYLDLFLAHWPNSGISIAGTVAAFERLRDEGKIRAWGVSNFTITHLRETVPHGTPATNQVELHPYFRQERLAAVCREMGVPLTAYSPLAKGRVADDAVLRRIAADHDATPAQVTLAWILAKGHAVIPKTSSEARLRENAGALELELSDAEVAEIDALPQGDRLVSGSWAEFDREGEA